MDELIQVLVGLALVIGVIYGVVYCLGFAVAYTGMTIVILLDWLSRGFVWLGVDTPTGGWFALGASVGGMAGLIIGLRRSRGECHLPKVYAGGAIVGLLAVILSAASPPPAPRGLSDSTPMQSAERHGVDDLLGTWHGKHGGTPATLCFTRTAGGAAFGTMADRGGNGVYKLAVKAYADSSSGRVTFIETKVLSQPDGEGWALGRNAGQFADGGRRITGTGKDSRGSTYDWSFRKAQ